MDIDGDPCTDLGGGVGTFGGVVWPTHLGAATGHPGGGPRPNNEPTDSPDYARGQIEWLLEEGKGIVGRALVQLPPGVYEYLVFTYGPADLPMMAGFSKFEHPLVFEKAGVMDVYPIQNLDVAPR